MTPFQERILRLVESRPTKFLVDQRHRLTMLMLAWYAAGGLIDRHLDTVCASVMGFVVLMSLMENERLTESRRALIKIQDELILAQRERLKIYDDWANRALAARANERVN